jgi:hypothetical protein
LGEPDATTRTSGSDGGLLAATPGAYPLLIDVATVHTEETMTRFKEIAVRAAVTVAEAVLGVLVAAGTTDVNVDAA